MKLNPLAIFQEEIDGNSVLFRADTGESFMLNEVATFLWKEFMNGNDEATALKNLKKACNEELPVEAICDLKSFIAELKENGYIAE